MGYRAEGSFLVYRVAGLGVTVYRLSGAYGEVKGFDPLLPSPRLGRPL